LLVFRETTSASTHVCGRVYFSATSRDPAGLRQGARVPPVATPLTLRPAIV